MSITIQCSDCDWEVTCHNEYESEIAFDRHCDKDHPEIANMTMQQLDDAVGWVHPQGYDDEGKRKA
jgi:hypothetical protein